MGELVSNREYRIFLFQFDPLRDDYQEVFNKLVNHKKLQRTKCILCGSSKGLIQFLHLRKTCTVEKFVRSACSDVNGVTVEGMKIYSKTNPKYRSIEQICQEIQKDPFKLKGEVPPEIYQRSYCQRVLAGLKRKSPHISDTISLLADNSQDEESIEALNSEGKFDIHGTDDEHDDKSELVKDNVEVTETDGNDNQIDAMKVQKQEKILDRNKIIKKIKTDELLTTDKIKKKSKEDKIDKVLKPRKRQKLSISPSGDEDDISIINNMNKQKTFLTCDTTCEDSSDMLSSSFSPRSQGSPWAYAALGFLGNGLKRLVGAAAHLIVREEQENDGDDDYLSQASRAQAELADGYVKCEAEKLIGEADDAIAGILLLKGNR